MASANRAASNFGISTMEPPPLRNEAMNTSAFMWNIGATTMPRWPANSRLSVPPVTASIMDSWLKWERTTPLGRPVEPDV